MTIILYSILFLFVFILTYRNKDYIIYKKRIFDNIVISGVILILFSGIRYDVGTDYLNYINIINWVEKGIFYKKSIFVYIIAKLLIYFNLGYYWFFIISSTVTVVFIYKTSKYILKDKMYLSILFFLISGFYFSTFNGVRAGVAASILFFAMKFIYERNFIKYLLFVFFAALWHIFSIIFIPLYFILNKKISYLVPIVFLIIFLNLKLIILYIAKLINYIPYFERYVFYLKTPYLQINDFNISFGIFLIFIVASATYLLYIQLDEKTKKESRIYMNLYLIGVLFYILSIKILIFVRLIDFFYYAQIFIIPIVVNNLTKRSRLIYISIITILLYVLLLKQTLDPHRKLVPYKTIFTEYSQQKIKKIIYE